MKNYTFTIKKDGVNERIDHYLIKVLPKEALSRNFIKKLINTSDILLNGKIIKPHHQLRSGDIITVNLPELEAATELEPQKIDLKIVYEDEDIVVVNKDAGMVVHPGAGVCDGTLVNALLYHCKSLPSLGGKSRPGIVHRIDRGTSGLLVVAKNDVAYRKLAKDFKEHNIKREYIAFVNGVVELDNGKVELPIARHPRTPKKMTVAFLNSKSAVTYYKVLKRFSDYTMLEIRPETGRTHQIRVHMAYLDHPLLGDAQYGRPDKRIARQALHAASLSFYHPRTDKMMEFKAVLPEDMERLEKDE